MAEEFDNKTTEDGYEDICRRPESKAGRMFKMPGNMTICMDCMEKTMETVSQFDYKNMMNNPAFMNGFGAFGNPYPPTKEEAKTEETKVQVSEAEEVETEEEEETKTPKRSFPNISFINLYFIH